MEVAPRECSFGEDLEQVPVHAWPDRFENVERQRVPSGCINVPEPYPRVETERGERQCGHSFSQPVQVAEDRVRRICCVPVAAAYGRAARAEGQPVSRDLGELSTREPHRRAGQRLPVCLRTGGFSSEDPVDGLRGSGTLRQVVQLIYRGRLGCHPVEGLDLARELCPSARWSPPESRMPARRPASDRPRSGWWGWAKTR